MKQNPKCKGPIIAEFAKKSLHGRSLSMSEKNPAHEIS